MKDYEERAERSLLDECNEFISANMNVKVDYETFSKAMNLSSSLINNLLGSPKDFDKKIQEELANFPCEKSDLEKNIFVYKFNQEQIRLKLDGEAHEILKKLETIINNCIGEFNSNS